MKKNLHNRFLNSSYFIVLIFFLSCGSKSAIISTPIENIDLVPLKVENLTDIEEKEWSHLDLKTLLK